jgi:formate dehydrogenase subunit delta
MSIEHLVRMANDIADYFRSEPDREAAIAGVSNHMKKFWDPRMRRQIAAHLREQAGVGLSELARAAVVQLGELDAAKAQRSQGR